MTTIGFRTPDGRIAVPVMHRDDMWLMINTDGSSAVAVGKLTENAQPLTVATPFTPGTETLAAVTTLARMVRYYRHGLDTDSAHDRGMRQLFESWPQLYAALDTLQRTWQQ